VTSMLDDIILTGASRIPSPREKFQITTIQNAAGLSAYHALRHDVFVKEQGLFEVTDRDEHDDDPRTIVLLAHALDDTAVDGAGSAGGLAAAGGAGSAGGGTGAGGAGKAGGSSAVPGLGRVLGGVRLHPMTGGPVGYATGGMAAGPQSGADLDWWRGSRLAVARDARSGLGIGAALIRAACAEAEARGAIRFDATVQSRNEPLFRRLGWVPREHVTVRGAPHVVVDWPVPRFRHLAAATKASLGPLLADLLGQDEWRGDDGTPVPGTDVIAATDAIIPSMVERDPEWAGWCSVLVNVNDLYAMGATPVGLMDALGARDASFARRVLCGLADAARAWGVPVLGGHTQLGVPAALSVTALGRTDRPVPAGGARPGQRLRVTADLGGGWRPGYAGSQWDSSTHRTPAELRTLAGVVPALAPTAAKDVSMSGLVGTAGMLAEASGCRVILDIAVIPAPASGTSAGVSLADWLTCFPGFAIVSTEEPGRPEPTGLPGFLASAICGELVPGEGVALRWPDGAITEAVTKVTGLGPATTSAAPRTATHIAAPVEDAGAAAERIPR
jgi:AIR synthase-related protein